MKKINNLKMEYSTPVFELIDVKVEKGFATSPGSDAGESDVIEW